MDHPFFMHVFHTLIEYMHAKSLVHYSSVYGNFIEINLITKHSKKKKLTIEIYNSFFEPILYDFLIIDF